MTENTIVGLLIGLTAVQAVVICVLGIAICSLMDSEEYKQKLYDFWKNRKKGNATKIIGVLLLVIIPNFVFGAETSSKVQASSSFAYGAVSILIGFNIFLVLVIGFLARLLYLLLTIDHVKEVKEETSNEWVNALLKRLTKAVPLEEEASVATDHEYDGIKELDNSLPPWWLYGFYASIVFGLMYLAHYHVFQTGTLQHEQYQQDIAKAELDVKAYLEAQAMNVDETNVTVLAEAEPLANGKTTFMQYCKVCHGEYGEGLVGPNLTDPYWIHGGSINNVFKTIKYGANRGMKSWKDELNPIQMQEVASFIKSLEGTKPANPKDPEGELYEEADESAETPKG